MGCVGANDENNKEEDKTVESKLSDAVNADAKEEEAELQDDFSVKPQNVFDSITTSDGKTIQYVGKCNFIGGDKTEKQDPNPEKYSNLRDGITAGIELLLIDSDYVAFVANANGLVTYYDTLKDYTTSTDNNQNFAFIKHDGNFDFYTGVDYPGNDAIIPPDSTKTLNDVLDTLHSGLHETTAISGAVYGNSDSAWYKTNINGPSESGAGKIAIFPA